MRILPEAMSIIYPKTEEICLDGFPGETGWDVRVNYFLILASYSYDIPDEKGMSGIRHETSVQRQSIQTTSKMGESQAIRCKKARSIHETWEVQKCCSDMPQAGSFCHEEEVHVYTSRGKMLRVVSKVSRFPKTNHS